MKPAGHVRCLTLKDRRDLVPMDGEGFLTLHRLTVASTFDDDASGPDYTWDAVLRKHIDAVAILLLGERGGRECVCLRSCVRPPLLLREDLVLAVPDDHRFETLWEIPAGLLEADDSGPDGIKHRAAIETWEETGCVVDASVFDIMPGPVFISPGVLPERVHFVFARVDQPQLCEVPPGDGSAAEERSVVWWVPVDEVLSMCDRGEIEDMKTELGLRRLAARAAG